MKDKLVIFFSVTFLLLACGGKTNTTLQHISPNGKVKVNIEGKRTSSVEAWKVDMNVKAYGFEEGKLSFEIYADDISDENVSFEWEDEFHCKIIIRQSDGEERTFQLIASPKQLQLAEI